MTSRPLTQPQTANTALVAPAPNDSACITPASPADLAYIVHLQKRESNSLGFCTRTALAEKIQRQRIWLVTDNAEPAGYLHHGSLSRPEVRIFQAAIQYDARRRHLGLALVADLERRATNAGATVISLRCLCDLTANEFWSAAGFTLAGTELAGRHRIGAVNVWIKRLAPCAVAIHGQLTEAPTRFEDGCNGLLHPRAGHSRAPRGGGTAQAVPPAWAFPRSAA